MFYDDAAGVVRVVVVGTLAYVWLLFVLRTTGKRTLAQLNAFDFIVTVALGSTLASAFLTETVSFTEGAVGLAILVILRFVVAWSAVRVPFIERAVSSRPAILLRDGLPLTDACKRHRVTHESLLHAVRSSGFGDLEAVGAVVLETNGTISVIGRKKISSGSALPPIPPNSCLRTTRVGPPGNRMDLHSGDVTADERAGPRTVRRTTPDSGHHRSTGRVVEGRSVESGRCD